MGSCPSPRPSQRPVQLLNQKDGYEITEVEQQIMAAHGTQMEGQFLIDAQGTIRWSYVEGANGLEDLVNFPATDDKILAAVEAMSR